MTDIYKVYNIDVTLIKSLAFESLEMKKILLETLNTEISIVIYESEFSRTSI